MLFSPRTTEPQKYQVLCQKNQIYSVEKHFLDSDFHLGEYTPPGRRLQRRSQVDSCIVPKKNTIYCNNFWKSGLWQLAFLSVCVSRSMRCTWYGHYNRFCRLHTRGRSEYILELWEAPLRFNSAEYVSDRQHFAFSLFSRFSLWFFMVLLNSFWLDFHPKSNKIHENHEIWVSDRTVGPEWSQVFRNDVGTL